MTAKSAKNAPQEAVPTEEGAPEPQECFIIMPISDQPGYESGHFTRVYRDIIAPACDLAGLKPSRADEDTSTNIIQHGILIKLLNAPVAICDLSSRNPNVMFELGLRQAFDKPVIIIQDEQTPAIFDISMLRYTSYRSGLLYHQVVEDQIKIANSFKSTIKDAEEGKSTNSLMKLLSIESAVLRDVDKGDIQSSIIESIQGQLSFIANRLNHIDYRESAPTLRSRKHSIPLNTDEEQLSNMVAMHDEVKLLMYNRVPSKLYPILEDRIVMGRHTQFQSSAELKEYLDLIKHVREEAQELVH
ncbi:hypothetical protein ACMT4L_20505 [Deinococcus sp. A31D244]|uniref:hypothetical protein n=1 Tax=Deinococcus sp. A31D244 TaxID=3397675 RepID=UPI0039E17B51